MLSEFIDCNKKKFFLMLNWTVAIFTAVTLICFLVGLFFGVKMDLGLSISILFATCIFFPIFFMTLGTLKEYMTFRNSRITLNKYPFKELTKNGFQEIYIYEDSKWNYTQLVLTGEFENYPMTCNVSNSIVKIIALADVTNIKSEHRKKLKAEFGCRIEYYWSGIALTFDTSSKKQLSIDELMNEIGRFIGLLKIESLSPKY